LTEAKGSDNDTFHKYAHAIEPGSSEDEFFSSKKAKLASIAHRKTASLEEDDDDALRFSSRGKVIANYDEVIDDALLMSEVEEYYDIVPVEEEGDVIETVLDYRITTITNEGTLSTR